MDLSIPKTSLAKTYEEKNEINVTMQIPKSDYNNEGFVKIRKWADTPVQHDDYYRDLAVSYKAAGDNYRTILFSHARITLKIHDETKHDFVTATIYAKQKEDQFVGVVLGKDLESAYEKAKEKVANPPLLNLVMPGMNTNYIIDPSKVVPPLTAEQQERMNKKNAERIGKIKMLKIEVIESEPSYYYPNCHFKIQYQIIEKLDKAVEVYWEKVNETDNLMLKTELDKKRETKFSAKTEVGTYWSDPIPYYKVDNSIYRGDYGTVKAYAVSSETENVTRALQETLVARSNEVQKLLFEVGRPKEVRFRYESKYNTLQTNESKFKSGDTVTVSFKQLTQMVDKIGAANIDKLISVAKFAGDKAIGILDRSGAFRKISDGIKDGLDLYKIFTASYSNVSKDVALTFNYEFNRVRKWIQYKDYNLATKQGEWINAFYLERLDTRELFKPADSIKGLFFENEEQYELVTAVQYYKKDYKSINQKKLETDDSYNYRLELLSLWRKHKQDGSAHDEVEKPGYKIRLKEYVTGEIANAANGKTVVADDLNILIYDLNPNISYHEKPENLSGNEPSYQFKDSTLNIQEVNIDE